MENSMTSCYRVECNFGCKYFINQDQAKAYFNRKANKHLDVELWHVSYCCCGGKTICATQELLAYSGTSMPKC